MDSFQASVSDRARKEVVIGVAVLLVTMGAFVLFFGQNYLNSRAILAKYLQGTGPERAVYNLIFAVFMYGSFTYQVSRLAFFWNIRARVKGAQESLARFVAAGASEAPAIEILVPSYKEESHVVWQTLVSAALLDYPNRRITLLLDDPPLSNSEADRDLLTRARAQAQIVADQLAPLASKFAAAARNFHTIDRTAADRQVIANEAASLYREAAAFLRTLAGQVRGGELGGTDDHTRTFFVERILLAPAAEHERHAAQLVDEPSSWDGLAREFDRLAYLFKVSLNTFERKKYVNLSHAATKAANLNAYISLMGRRFEVVTTEEGQFLNELSGADAGSRHSLSLRDAEFVVVLDADSFLLPDYATCMIAALQAPDSKRIAVMQTPYTSIPNTPHRIERAAAATTDIYYYVTEGMSFARAGSWIGAAAVIRKQALLDIVTYENERGTRHPGLYPGQDRD